ncbi:MAG: PRC-barrel domain-containing protein [Bacillota bacterium]
MQKGYEIIDLPVVNLETGEEVGDIKDIVFDPDQGTVVGFIVDGGSFFQGNRMIPYQQVHSLGEDALTIANDEAVSDLDEVKEYLVSNQGNVIGAKVVTDDGKELGTIGDIVLNSDDGQIASYEVTDGLVHDILDGRGLLDLSDDINYGDDVVVVSNIDNYQQLNQREE